MQKMMDDPPPKAGAGQLHQKRQIGQASDQVEISSQHAELAAARIKLTGLQAMGLLSIAFTKEQDLYKGRLAGQH